MPRSAFIAESKGEQWRVTKPGTDWPDRVRMGPSVAAVLDAVRPVTQDRGDQLVEEAVKAGIAKLIFDGRFEEAQRHLGTLTGLAVTEGDGRAHSGHAGTVVVPSGTGDSGRDRKPLARAR